MMMADRDCPSSVRLFCTIVVLNAWRRPLYHNPAVIALGEIAIADSLLAFPSADAGEIFLRTFRYIV
jgi:hypothetical protein